MVESTLHADGVGSMTMRHLAAWIFAEEVGCDWVVPNWGRPLADGDGTSMYCHTAATTDEEQRGFNATADGMEAIAHRCSVTNWLEYFNFKATAVELPVADSFRVVQVRGIVYGKLQPRQCCSYALKAFTSGVTQGDVLQQT